MSEVNIDIKNKPDAYEGQGFIATKLDQVVGLAQRILYGHCLLRHRAVALNLWLRWEPTMTLPDLGWKD